MKRLMMILFAIGMVTMSSTSMAAMSKSKVRKEARFLTDKMAYELSLSTGQRNDAYEINYDFIYSIRNVMDDVMRGEEWAMDRYYYLLDLRNDDLRWVLSDYQYRRFMERDYFFRPVYTSGSKWAFRIYITYTNPGYFYFGRPHHYSSYHCDHYRRHHNHVSYYRGRYTHNVYGNAHHTRDSRYYETNRRSDFNTVKVRPGTSRPSSAVSSSSRKATPRTSSSSSSTVNTSPRRNSSSTTTRPSSSTTRPSTSSRSSSTGAATRSSSSSRSSNSTGTSRSGSSDNSGPSRRSSVNSSSSSRSSSSSSSVRSSSSGSSSSRSSSTTGSSRRGSTRQ